MKKKKTVKYEMTRKDIEESLDETIAALDELDFNRTSPDDMRGIINGINDELTSLRDLIRSKIE